MVTAEQFREDLERITSQIRSLKYLLRMDEPKSARNSEPLDVRLNELERELIDLLNIIRVNREHERKATLRQHQTTTQIKDG
jgi:hypothetical protein